MFKQLNNQHGSILLLALLILSGSLVTGLTIGTIVLSEIRQSRNLDDAIVAYHAAASGIEQAIYFYRQDINNFNLPEVSSGNPPAGNEVDCDFEAANFIAGCEYYFTKAASQSFSLAKGEVRQINLFNPDLLGGYGVEYLEVDWWDENIANSLEPWLEMEIIEMPNDWNGLPTRESINLVKLCSDGVTAYPTGDPVGNTESACGQWTDNNLYISSGQHYKIRFRPLYDDVQITVTARDGADNIVGSGRINIFANGAYQAANQAVRAELSNIKTSKDFADYVIFSDCDIVKGAGSVSSCN